MCKIVLSFDDGRRDNVSIALDVLKPRDIPATFNIATAYVDGTISPEQLPCPNESMDISQVQALYRAGFEIAGHGDCHQNTAEDIAAGIKKLRQWLELPKDAPIGFASPQSQLSTDVILNWKQEFQENSAIRCVRIGLKDNTSLHLRLFRKAAAMTGNKKLFTLGFSNALMDLKDQYILYSVPVMYGAKLEQICAIVQQAIAENKDCILMFHSILRPTEPYYENTWSWDYDQFLALCDYLVAMRKQGKIELCTTAQAVGYGN